MLNMVVTGGASRFISDFLEFGGGSATIVGFAVPYNVEAQEKFLGYPIDYKCVSIEHAFNLANKAYIDFKELDEDEDTTFKGVGATASLIKGENEREGRINEFFVGIADETHVNVHHIVIDKKMFGCRSSQEVAISEVLLNIIAGDDRDLQGRYLRERKYIGLNNEPTLDVETSFFIGSFNPIHDGHIGIYDYLVKEYKQVFFERSLLNRDKPATRLYGAYEQFKASHLYKEEYKLIITETALILDKIEYFREVGFERINIAMGMDTWVRFIEDLDGKTVELNNVSFTVFNRGDYMEFHDYGYDVMFIKDYNIDMSSTEIRNKQLTAK
jgi:nicotinic acid mononucleotide adenylyltransferase